MMPRVENTLLPALIAALAVAGPVCAQEEETGHMHGPDGRHIAVAETFGASGGKSVLSHHDLMITDTSKFSMKKEGAVVEGADVHSVIHKKADPKAVVHREHNTYEPENGVYGSHMMYREPGEYVIVENVTLPGGKKYTLEFPIWVPAPAGAAPPAAKTSPLTMLFGIAGVLILVVGAYLIGRRGARHSAAVLAVIGAVTGLSQAHFALAQEEEAGHMHGPDGRHIAVAETFGSKPGDPLKAFLGPNREIEAFQTKDQYQFRLSIENEEMAPPDPSVVSLTPEAAAAIGLKTATAQFQPVAGGLSTTGSVQPNPNGKVTVNSRVAGRVVRVNVTPGQTVAHGDVIAIVDSTEVAEAQAAYRKALAELTERDAGRLRAASELRRMEAFAAETEAGLSRVRAQRSEAEAEVERARADLDTARSKAEGARKTLARQQQLAAAGAFAQGPVEAARSAIAAAEGELREAQTALGNQEVQVRRMEAGLRAGVIARKDLEAAQTTAAQGRSRVSTAERQLEIAKTALAREERIQRENLRDAREVQTAQAELEGALAAVRSAEAAVIREQKAVEAAQSVISGQERTIASSKAQVEAARSGVREAEATFSGARQAVRSALTRLQLLGANLGGGNQVSITAPLGGRVHERPVNTGQVVAAGEPIATVVNTASVWVESNVFEKDLNRVRLGQQVEIGAEGLSGTFNGVISYISHDVDPATRVIRVRTVVPNAGEKLKPNMFVRVVIGSNGGTAVTVPVEALQERGGEQVVFIAESADSYRMRVVQVGSTLGDQVVIESGVKPGQKVVTRGSHQLLARVRK